MKEVSVRTFKHVHVYCVLDYHCFVHFVIGCLFHVNQQQSAVRAICFNHACVLCSLFHYNLVFFWDW